MTKNRNINLLDITEIENMRVLLNILCKQRCGLHVCHLNAQSLYPKIDEFKYVFENSNIDIIGVSETWFKTDLSDNLCNIKGYDLFRVDRIGNRGGGIAMHVRSSLTKRLVVTSENSSTVEYCFLEILNGRNKCLVGVIYRPNRYVDFSQLLTVLENISSNYTEIILCGDFNCNLLERVTSSSFVEKMSSLGVVTNNNSVPTHFTNNSATLLDLFFTNNIENILFYDQIEAPAYSKHDLIFATFNIIPRSEKIEFEYRDYKRINFEQLENDICRIEWQQIYLTSSVDIQVAFLQNSVQNLFDKHVRTKVKMIKNQNNSWFTQEIKELIKKRDSAYKHWKRFRLPNLLNLFRVIRNLVCSKIKAAKMNKYSKLLSSDLPSKTLWRNIRDLGIGRQKRMCPEDINPNDLNFYFAKIQSIPQNEIEISDEIPDPNNSFQFHRIEETDVLSNLLKIKSKATGFDEMSPVFIKMILPHILPSVTHIFNTIIMTCKFPNNWKDAKVIPIPKNTTKRSPTEYRPISILPFLSKVLEKILHNQISTFIKSNNLLCSNQSGYRSHHSCVSAILKVTDDVRCAMDEDHVSFLALLDFSKAFDTVSHKILISKLKHQFSFSDTAARLILSFLSIRIGDNTIEYVGKVKNLGIWFDSTLNWNTHVQTIIGKIYFSLRSLSYTKHFTPENIRLHLAKSLISPIITYGCQIFSSFNAETKRCLNIAFNNIVRYVYNLKRFDHVSPYKEKILGCSLNAYLKYIALKTLNNIIIKKEPLYLYNKLIFSSSNRSFSFIQPIYTCTATMRQFFVCVIKSWNSLPLNIRKLRGTPNFDRTLFRYLAEHYE